MKTYTVFWTDGLRVIRTAVDNCLDKETAKRKFLKLHPKRSVMKILKSNLKEYKKREQIDRQALPIYKNLPKMESAIHNY